MQSLQNIETMKVMGVEFRNIPNLLRFYEVDVKRPILDEHRLEVILKNIVEPKKMQDALGVRTCFETRDNTTFHNVKTYSFKVYYRDRMDNLWGFYEIPKEIQHIKYIDERTDALYDWQETCNLVVEF